MDLGDDFTRPQVPHEAVTLAGIADTGPILPLLSGLIEAQRNEVGQVARELLRREGAGE